MKKSLRVAVVVVLVFAAGIAVGQLSYPDADDPAVILDNEHVVVQRFSRQPSQWVGVHKHAGNQLVVILEDAKLMYRVGDEEMEKDYKAGDVFWIDEVEHDHRAISQGGAVIVTLK